MCIIQNDKNVNISCSVCRDYQVDYQSLLWRMLCGKRLRGARFCRNFNFAYGTLDFFARVTRIHLRITDRSVSDLYGEDHRFYLFLKQRYGIYTHEICYNSIVDDTERVIQEICQLVTSRGGVTHDLNLYWKGHLVKASSL